MQDSGESRVLVRENGVAEPGRRFVDDASGDGVFLWQQVDLALQEGVQVWFSSPLLEPLMDSLGRDLEGRRWLVLEPGGSRLAALARLVDLLLSGLALILLSPLLLVIGLLIKIGSKGPVLFSTTVMGKERRPFVWHKLRSMRVMPASEDVERRRERFKEYVEGRRLGNAEEAPTKVIDKTRVTPVGAFIRKYSIDELPQLWNVLRGDMSLVGPRPCLPYEAEFFTSWRGRRFKVKPGLSGVWQVFGRGRVSFEEAAAMDVYYIYRRSLAFDAYLIFKTLGVVFSGRGAL